MDRPKTWSSNGANEQQMKEFGAVLHAINTSLKNGIRHLNNLNGAPAANYDLKETLKTMSITVKSLEDQAMSKRLKLSADHGQQHYSIRRVRFFVSRDVRREGFLAFYDPSKDDLSEDEIIREMVKQKLCVKSVAQQIISLDYTPDAFIGAGDQHEMLVGVLWRKNYMKEEREFRIFTPLNEKNVWQIEYLNPKTKIWELENRVSFNDAWNIEDVLMRYIPGQIRITCHWVLRWEIPEGEELIA